MKTFNIALYPGDGIGVDVVDEAVRVLDHVQKLIRKFRLEYTRFPWGADFYAEHGKVVPDDFLDQLRPFDAIFLGALGYPQKIPDHITLAPLVQMRQKFDQYACVRPARLLPGIRSPLADPGTIDMVVIRENSEGEYVTCGGRYKMGEPEEFAVQTSLHTRKGVERVLRFGFELARTRRKRLTMITKSNALKYGMVLWDEILEQIRPQYPDIASDKLHVDAASMDFVRRPNRFDVIVASNLFGDILTDLVGAMIGGLGLAPSANINPERKYPSMFEPVHGSAPDIIGKGIANPVAAIQSAAMMLDWLGLPEPAAIIQRAVQKTLARYEGTPDLGGTLTTTQMTDAIIRNLGDA